VIYHIEDKLKKSNGHNDILSRNTIGESLKTIDAAVFQKHVPIPPQTPAKPLVLDQVSYKHEHLFIAGRYCKYSRNLFQTPWILEDTVIKSSVQEIIFQALDNIFKYILNTKKNDIFKKCISFCSCGSLVFSSSGREDFDVRTLGRGRPFFIKICDPKITKVSFEKFRSIEEAIRQTNLVKVRDLQFIDRKYVNNIKEGEQFKQKTYRALCVVKQPENLQIYIDKINNISNIMLEQKTPIRVYHRRSSDVRKREIYKIKARPVTGECIFCDESFTKKKILKGKTICLNWMWSHKLAPM
jgi:tRNA pseudouridine synthase 10